MEMSFNLAATTAASAANNVTQTLNNEVLQLDSAASTVEEVSKELPDVLSTSDAHLQDPVLKKDFESLEGTAILFYGAYSALQSTTVTH